MPNIATIGSESSNSAFTTVSSKQVAKMGSRIVKASHDEDSKCKLLVALALGILMTVIGAVLWGVGAGIHSDICLKLGIAVFAKGLVLAIITGVVTGITWNKD